MSIKDFTFITLLLIGGLFISYVMQGSYFGTADVDTINALAVIRTWNVGGLFTVPILNINFFTVGLPKLITWDFAFFGGGYQIVQFLFYAISVGVVWGVTGAFIGIVTWQK